MKCVLVIDDSRAAAFMAQAVFRRKGARVLMALDGKTGIQMARLNRPDVILLDYYLPDMDGADVARELKTTPETAAIPILVVTAYREKEIEERCREVGVDDILYKPYTNDELIERVSRLLKLPYRQHIRVLVRLEVETEVGSNIVFGTSENISESGIYLYTSHRFQMNDEVKLRFFLPRDRDPIVTRAVIRRTEIRPEYRGYGYGMEFVDLKDTDKRRIHAFIEARKDLIREPLETPPDTASNL